MNKYKQQAKWRAIYQGKSDRKHFVEAILGKEGWASLGFELDTKGTPSSVGWHFQPDELWEGWNKKFALDSRLGPDARPHVWSLDDELDFPDDPEITQPRLEAMKAAILHVANEITGPSFTRFCELVPHFSGPRIFSFPETKIHLWHGLSSLAIKALKELSNEGKLVAERAPFALYSIDGGTNSVMKLPRLQKTVSQGEGFVQPFDSWLPLVFWTKEQISRAKGKQEAKRIILTDGGEKESWQKTTDWEQAETKVIQGEVILKGTLEAPLLRLTNTKIQSEEKEVEKLESLPQTNLEE